MHLHRRLGAPLRRRSERDEDGFTLIELLVVITILGILAAIVIFAVKGIGDKGKASAVKADAAVLRTAEETYCAKFGQYATIDELQDAKFLASDATYNSVALGDDGKCGTGTESSFQIFDSSAPTTFLNSGIDLGSDSAPADVAIDAKTNRVYVSDSGTNSVSVVNGSTDAVSGAPIAVGSAPTNIAVDPNTNKIYVLNTGDNTASIIDGTTNTVVNTVDLPGDGQPASIAVNPVTDEVFVATFTTNLTVIGGTSNTASVLDVGSEVDDAPIVVNTKTNTVFALSDGGLEVIDGRTSGAHAHEVTTVPYPDPPADVVQRSPQKFIAVNERTNKVYGLAVDAVDVNGLRKQIAQIVTFDGADGYAASGQSNAYDVARPAWTSLAVNPNTNQVIAFGGLASTLLGAATRFDVATNAFTGQATGANRPNVPHSPVPYHQVAVNPNTNRMYVSQRNGNGGSGGLLTVDLNMMLTSTIGTPNQYSAFAINPVTNKIYAADIDNGKLAVLR